MRVVVTGATGNVGTSLLRALTDDADVDDVIGLARRTPDTLDVPPSVRWVEEDITTAEQDLARAFAGADVIVHLAWVIQPSRDVATLWRINVDGTARVLAAAARAGVSAVVVASSVGAYSPAEESQRVAEDWPTHGIPTSSYSMAKAYIERMLDAFALEHPDIRVVRVRPGLIFKREAATEIRRFFVGALLPPALLDHIPAVPVVPSAVFQAVHTDDIAEAYRLAVVGDATGAFNVAAEPVLDLGAVADELDARRIPLGRSVLRAGTSLTWRLRLHPVDAGWVDLALGVPVMDITRAREVLGWHPRHDAREALAELLKGMREGAGAATPKLRPDSLARRVKELATGQGARGSTDPRA